MRQLRYDLKRSTQNFLAIGEGEKGKQLSLKKRKKETNKQNKKTLLIQSSFMTFESQTQINIVLLSRENFLLGLL